ncbi:MAG: hypothetical protein LC114_19585 [Bryobacterales bacterium]|nr:hypothetical protein [Bryobacterales bacterium]
MACVIAILLIAPPARPVSPTEFWPPVISRGGDTLWLGAPTLESWDYLRVRLSSPAQHKSENGETTSGTIYLEANAYADRVRDVVALSDFKVLKCQFEGELAGDSAARQARIGELLRGLQVTAPLDLFVDAFYRGRNLPSIEVSSDVPRIFAAKKPAVLLQFDGPPMWLPVEGSKLSFAVNTNWDVFYDNKSTFYYLLAGDTWLATHDLASTEWVLPKSLPKELKNLPRTPDFANVWKHLPYKPDPDVALPVVYYSEGPAELILLDGEPVLKPVVQGLSEVANSRSDVFFDTPGKRYLFLVAGRWFEARELGGFWREAVSLPPSLAEIPRDDPRSHVRSQIPGTEESRREAFRATVPHIAKIRRAGPKIEVEYAGRPQYTPIDGTSLMWIPNANIPIVVHAGELYACQHGLWFHANSPAGPWEVAASIPTDIYRIPPQSPVFRLSFVRLISSDEATVTIGYTAGYENVFVRDGIPIYGTGYPHPPALQYGAFAYPIYFAQPATYGVGAWYDAKQHVFLRGRPGYGPFGGFGATCRFNNVTNHYFRAQTLYGDDVGERPSLAFLPYTAAYGKLRESYDPYAAWGDSVVGRSGTASQLVTRTQPAPSVTIEVGTPKVGAPEVAKPGAGFQASKPQ